MDNANYSEGRHSKKSVFIMAKITIISCICLIIFITGYHARDILAYAYSYLPTDETSQARYSGVQFYDKLYLDNSINIVRNILYKQKDPLKKKYCIYYLMHVNTIKSSDVLKSYIGESDNSELKLLCAYVLAINNDNYGKDELFVHFNNNNSLYINKALAAWGLNNLGYGEIVIEKLVDESKRGIENSSILLVNITYKYLVHNIDEGNNREYKKLIICPRGREWVNINGENVKEEVLTNTYAYWEKHIVNAARLCSIK